ncbi:hypothetical protein JG687_00015737, partial [Phytophthora cactorum]
GCVRPCSHRASDRTAVKPAAATDGWSTKIINRATTSKCFLTVQIVLEVSMRVRGGSSYDIPPLQKDARIRAGKLPRCISCSAEAMQMSL